MEKSLGVFARRFFSGTLLSRISGMGRDLAMAFAFGDSPSVAAFMVAFRLSNLFRRLLGEGPLQSAFIPHFEGLRSNDHNQASFFFRKLVLVIALIALVLTALAEGGLLTAYFFGGLSEGNKEIVHLSAWLFPGLLFICLYGLNISLLNCYDSFFLPSFAPFVCNAIWISAVLLLQQNDPNLAMVSLAKWVVVGFIAQWLLTMPLTLKYVKGSFTDWFKVSFSPEVMKLFKTFSLGAIGVGAVQINAMADSFFARYADVRGPTYLWYSIRLEQLALAIFGIACVATITPRLSRAIKESRFMDAQDLFSFGFSRIMTVMIPCTFAIGVLGLSAVNLIYGRGHFSESAVLKTNACLIAYGMGLVPTTLILLYSTVYYAKDSFWLPMLISIFSVGFNLVLNSVFVFVLDFGAVSTALTTSVSAFLNFLILFVLLKLEGWKMGYAFADFFHISMACLMAVLSTLTMAYYAYGISVEAFIFSSYVLPSKSFDQLVLFSTLSIAFLVGLLAYAMAFQIRLFPKADPEFS